MLAGEKLAGGEAVQQVDLEVARSCKWTLGVEGKWHFEGRHQRSTSSATASVSILAAGSRDAGRNFLQPPRPRFSQTPRPPRVKKPQPMKLCHLANESKLMFHSPTWFSAGTQPCLYHQQQQCHPQLAIRLARDVCQRDRFFNNSIASCSAMYRHCFRAASELLLNSF